MNRIFADAGYWAALRNRRDALHPRALQVARRLVNERWAVITTPFVFAEAYAILSRMPNARQQVVRDTWENPIVQMEQPSYDDQQEALALLKEHADKTFSFTDALSFVIMGRLELRYAVSFDGHFKQFGKFELIDYH